MNKNTNSVIVGTGRLLRCPKPPHKAEDFGPTSYAPGEMDL